MKDGRRRAIRGKTGKICRNGDAGEREAGADGQDWSLAEGSHTEKRWDGEVAMVLAATQSQLSPKITDALSSSYSPGLHTCFLGCAFFLSRHGLFLLLSQDTAHFQVFWEDVPDPHAYGGCHPWWLSSTQDRVCNRTAAYLPVSALDPFRDHADLQPSHSSPCLHSTKEWFVE